MDVCIIYLFCNYLLSYSFTFFYLLLVTMVIFNHKTKCFVLTSLWLVNVLQYL